MEYKILNKKLAYNGFFKLNLVEYQFEHFEGEQSTTCTSEIFERNDCVIVLPFDPITKKVLMIEQFRIATASKTENPWLLELIAGIIETNETPSEVAQRESIEEAGCTITNLKLIYKFFTSPGGCSEQAWLFYANFDSDKTSGIHGLINEGENIKVHCMTIDDCKKLIDAGKILNGPALIGLQWLLLQKDLID